MGDKVSNFVRKLNVTDVYKIPKFAGFDRESRPRPFKQYSHVQIYLLFCRTKLMDSSYILWNKFQDYRLRFILSTQFLVTA